jgi:tRNA-modifying protein YgfZ
MGSAPASTTPLPDYTAARERLAHRIRPGAIVDVTGEDRIAFLQGQLTQEMRDLPPGEARAVAGLTPKGKLLFVARAVALPDRVRLLAPSALHATIADHLRKYVLGSRVAIEDRSDDFARVGLYGPESGRPALPDDLVRLTGEGEFAAELVVPAARRDVVVESLERAGSEPVGEDAAEILRVEAGRPRFGVDMDSSNLPDEVGMADAISTSKGCYVGQEVVARLRTYGRVNRRLVGFRFPEGAVGAGTALRRTEEEGAEPERTEAGRVTSSVVSPAFGPIGLGYAFRDVEIGATLFPVYSGGCLVPTPPPDERAIVTALPFA